VDSRTLDQQREQKASSFLHQEAKYQIRFPASGRKREAERELLKDYFETE
jgi:hypothetical protein